MMDYEGRTESFSHDDPNVLFADEATVGLSTYDEAREVTLMMRVGEVMVVAPMTTKDATAYAMAILEAVQEVSAGQPAVVQ